MTVQEKLSQEFDCAIIAVLGDLAKEKYDEEESEITKGEIISIAQKVLFYLDLN